MTIIPGIVIHRTEPASPTVNVKLEKNSRGTNYECTVVGARSPEEAERLLRDLRDRMERVVSGEAATDTCPECGISSPRHLLDCSHLLAALALQLGTSLDATDEPEAVEGAARDG